MLVGKFVVIWLACDVCGNLLVCLGFLGICGRFAGVFGICWYFVDNLVVGLGFFGILWKVCWCVWDLFLDFVENLLVYFGFFGISWIVVIVWEMEMQIKLVKEN